MVEDIRVARWPASRGCWRCACQFPSEAYKLGQQSERIYVRYRNCPRDRFGDLPQGASLRDHWLLRRDHPIHVSDTGAVGNISRWPRALGSGFPTAADYGLLLGLDTEQPNPAARSS